MGLGMLRVWVAVALMAAGALMYAASWQRWSGRCPWGNDPDTRTCDLRMDHLYDFLPPAQPWEPAGRAAELAGASLLVFAAALVLLPWALAGRRPGPGTAAALLVCVVALVDVGTAVLRSGLSGTVVQPLAGDTTFWIWVLGVPVLCGWLALRSRGWSVGAAVLLVLGSPLVAAFTYAIGSFDANPWYEAIIGVFMGGAGLCLLVEAVRRPVRPGRAVVPSPAA